MFRWGGKTGTERVEDDSYRRGIGAAATIPRLIRGSCLLTIGDDSGDWDTSVSMIFEAVRRERGA